MDLGWTKEQEIKWQARTNKDKTRTSEVLKTLSGDYSGYSKSKRFAEELL